MDWLRKNAAVVVLLVQLCLFCFAVGCFWERVNEMQAAIAELKTEVKALGKERGLSYGAAQVDP